MSDCLFCQIVNNEIPANKIYEDDRVLAFLDIKPKAPGHALAITKKHFADFGETPDDELAYLMKIVKQQGELAKQRFGADGYNININCGESAGQIIPHIHVHIIPRKSNN